MELKMDRFTFSYEYEDYMLDIVITPDTYELWIYQESYGVKLFIIGVSKDSITLERFKDYAEENVEDFIEYFVNDFEI